MKESFMNLLVIPKKIKHNNVEVLKNLFQIYRCKIFLSLKTTLIYFARKSRRSLYVLYKLINFQNRK
jgi:hypothetical protein